MKKIEEVDIFCFCHLSIKDIITGNVRFDVTSLNDHTLKTINNLLFRFKKIHID